MGLVAAACVMIWGVWLSIRSGFVQFRRFGEGVRTFIPKRVPGQRGVGPFEAAATSLAATIGTGNIAGVAGAILLAGPGTIFWMWISALAGMVIKYAEILFCLRFRSRPGTGGPMECMEKVMGRRFPAALYASLALLSAFGMGNLVQARTISVSLCTAMGLGEPVYALGAGCVLGALMALSLTGGAKAVGRVAALLVPGVSVLYLGGALAVLCKFGHRIPAALASIVEGALTPRAALGGAAGYGFIRVMRVGVIRGIFTHEAGLGTGCLSHGAAQTRDARSQALYGITETFFDTIVMCTMTALVILVTAEGVSPLAMGDGTALAMAAFGAGLGRKAAEIFIAGAMTLFAFSSMLAFGLYAQRCAGYLAGKAGERIARFLFAGAAVLGAALDTQRVWSIAEYCNACLALPNLAMLWLAEKKTGLMKSEAIAARGRQAPCRRQKQ